MTRIRNTMTRIRNDEVRDYVDRREPFHTKDSTSYALFSGKGRYVVFVYGFNNPLYVYDDDLEVWFGNADTHETASESLKAETIASDVKINWLTHEDTRALIDAGSYAAHCTRRILNQQQ